ncbi:response regulator [candidate division KSB1 bacterium]|nr:response regulator [candidate division KSB1 bacterium]
MYNILIVDDEKELRETSAELLRMEGYEVVCAADGDDAQAKSGDKNFDLALIDLVLPGRMNGLDIISNLRSKSSNTYIIAFTGFSGQNFSQKAIKAGANEFVTKPGLAKNLVDNINKFFNRESTSKHKKPESATIATQMSKENFESDLHFNFNIFANIPDKNIKELMALGERKKIAVGDNHVMDVTKELVIITHGSMACWYQNSIIGYYKAGDAIGETSVFLSGQTKFLLVLKSEEEFELLVINRNEIAKYLQENKNFAFRFAVNTILSMTKKFMVTCERIARMNEEVRLN